MLKQSDFEKLDEAGHSCDQCGMSGIKSTAVWQTKEPQREWAGTLINGHVFFCQDCYEACED